MKASAGKSSRSKKPTISKRKSTAPSARYPFDNDAAEELAVKFQKHPNSLDAQGDFYTIMHPMVVAAVNTFAGSTDSHTREDLTQDALLKIDAAIDSFDRRNGKLHSWATMITKNLCIDYFRRQRTEFMDNRTLDMMHEGTVDKLLDTEFFTELRAFFPFYCPSRLFALLYEAVERSQFTISPAVIRRIDVILTKEEIDTSSAGRPVDIAQFLVAMIRGWLFMHNEEHQAEIVARIEHYPRLGAIRALKHYIGAKRAALAIFLLGGMSVKVPTAQEIMEHTTQDYR
jgi:RNA polymerase sigma factor (sigma-70 family)